MRLKEREKVFSTGLNFEEMGIAIPHTDSIHVNRQAIAVGILKEPVKILSYGYAGRICEMRNDVYDGN